MKQVVSHTIKAAVRGNLQVVDGRFTWGLGLFHTLNNDDIINWKTAALRQPHLRRRDIPICADPEFAVQPPQCHARHQLHQPAPRRS